MWFHRYRELTFVSPVPGGPPPDQHRRNAEDVFLWGADLLDGAVIVDVGAGIGTELFTFSAIAGSDGAVIAVEAHPRTFRFIHANATRNHLRNVELVQVAIADHSGMIGITDDLDSHLANSIVVGQRQLLVPAQTLDSLLGERSISRIDLLKVNIEGAEVAALIGAAKTLAATQHVYVECHDFEADRTGNELLRTRDAVIQILKGAGFQLRSRTDDPRPWVRDSVYAHR